jgi:hypothetical protein
MSAATYDREPNCAMSVEVTMPFRSQSASGFADTSAVPPGAVPRGIAVRVVAFSSAYRYGYALASASCGCQFICRNHTKVSFFAYDLADAAPRSCRAALITRWSRPYRDEAPGVATNARGAHALMRSSRRASVARTSPKEGGAARYISRIAA